MGFIRKKNIKLVPHALNRTKKKTNKDVKRTMKIIGKDVRTILDIGACIGTFSLFFTNVIKNDDLKIYAFEPVPSSYNILIKNIEANNFGKWIKPFNFGLDNKESNVIMGIPFHRSHEGNNGLYTIKSGREKLRKKVTCKVVRLKDFVKKHNIYSIDLIKIDTEGKEIDILKDSIEILPFVKYIHIEINTYFEDSKKITPFLKDIGFSYIRNTYNINEVWKNSNYLG